MENTEERLKAMLDWEASPPLSQSEIDGLLAAAATADPAGRVPDAEDWEPSYDLNLAAAMGWAIKAARTASSTETNPETLAVTSRIFENCLRLARHYSQRRAAAVNFAAARIF